MVRQWHQSHVFSSIRVPPRFAPPSPHRTRFTHARQSPSDLLLPPGTPAPRRALESHPQAALRHALLESRNSTIPREPYNAPVHEGSENIIHDGLKIRCPRIEGSSPPRLPYYSKVCSAGAVTGGIGAAGAALYAEAVQSRAAGGARTEPESGAEEQAGGRFRDDCGGISLGNAESVRRWLIVRERRVVRSAAVPVCRLRPRT